MPAPLKNLDGASLREQPRMPFSEQRAAALAWIALVSVRTMAPTDGAQQHSASGSCQVVRVGAGYIGRETGWLISMSMLLERKRLLSIAKLNVLPEVRREGRERA